MATKQFDTSKIYVRSDQPTICPYCGARTKMMLDFSHTKRQVQVHQCLNVKCGYEFFEETNEADLFPKIRLSYLYRDAGNFKLHHSVIVANPDNTHIKTVEEIIRNHLFDGAFFTPTVWELPKPEFDELDEEKDHGWCEFEGLELTNEIADVDVTITELLDIIKRQDSSQFQC